MTKKVTITIDTKLLKDLLKRAEKEHRSLSSLINHLLHCFSTIKENS